MQISEQANRDIRAGWLEAKTAKVFGKRVGSGQRDALVYQRWYYAARFSPGTAFDAKTYWYWCWFEIRSWETVERNMHANPTLFGWGSLDPMELYHHYSKAAGVRIL